MTLKLSRINPRLSLPVLGLSVSIVDLEGIIYLKGTDNIIMLISRKKIGSSAPKRAFASTLLHLKLAVGHPTASTSHTACRLHFTFTSAIEERYLLLIKARTRNLTQQKVSLGNLWRIRMQKVTDWGKYHLQLSDELVDQNSDHRIGPGEIDPDTVGPRLSFLKEHAPTLALWQQH